MFKFDLQLFAENSGSVAAEPQGQEPAATESSAEPVAFDYENATRDQRREAVMSFFAEPEQTEPPAQQQQAVTEAQEPTELGSAEPAAEIPAKFLNADGTPNIDALVKSYVNAEKKIGEQGNKMGQQAQQVQPRKREQHNPDRQEALPRQHVPLVHLIDVAEVFEPSREQHERHRDLRSRQPAARLGHPRQVRREERQEEEDEDEA